MKRHIFILILFISFFAEGQGILQNLERLRQEQISTAPAYDTDAQAFITAVATLTAPQEVAINNLVVGLKANGIWTKCHAIYPIIGGTASAHKFNLKDPRDLDAAFRLTFSGTVTHSSTGMVSNATTGFANTYYNPAANGTTNDVSLIYYSRTISTPSQPIEMGVHISASERIALRIRWGADARSYFQSYNTTSGNVSRDIDNSQGLFVASRLSASDARIFKNATQVGATHTTSGGTVPNANIYIMAINNAGTAAFFSDRECAFATIGLGLTSSEVSALYTLIQSYQTALGREI